MVQSTDNGTQYEKTRQSLASSHKATGTNVHFVDIVRPSLEDFQPIALRLRLALLGIYIVKGSGAEGTVSDAEAVART